MKKKVGEVKKWFHLLGRESHKELGKNVKDMIEICKSVPEAYVYASKELLEEDALLKLIPDDKIWILEQIKDPTEKIKDKILEVRILGGGE